MNRNFEAAFRKVAGRDRSVVKNDGPRGDRKTYAEAGRSLVGALWGAVEWLKYRGNVFVWYTWSTIPNDDPVFRWRRAECIDRHRRVSGV
jgi:hypothetical protein